MSEPIKSGDLAEVVGGVTGAASPNLGLVVRVLTLAGEHSKYGRIWRCEAEYASVQQPGVNCPPGQVDFAQSWLRKINPPAPPTKVQEKEKVNHE